MTLSLRPAETSTVPRPRLTSAVLPVTRTTRSASRIAGSDGIGRSVVPLVSNSTDRPSGGVGGPLALKSANGALPATTTRSTTPLETCSSTHLRTSMATNIGQMRFITDIGMRVQATPNAKCGSAPE